jgi:RNA polymerase sigma-70 factor (ECF subfamily)
MSDSGLNDELIARLEAGDDHAFVELFSRYRSRLKQMLAFRMDRRLRGREDESDILQEVYIDAHQRMQHYLKRPELSFYVWLRQLTTQRLIDIHRRHLKAEKRNVKQEVSINRHSPAATSASMAVQLVSHLASPSQVAVRAEMVVQIEEALESMDDIDREVLALRHFEELRNSEVAEVLGLKEAAASNRYVRALSRLRDVLKKFPGFFDDAGA